MCALICFVADTGDMDGGRSSDKDDKSVSPLTTDYMHCSPLTWDSSIHMLCYIGCNLRALLLKKADGG